MRSMIYYPGFELENETWLKFALLYFEELRPIIPPMVTKRENYLSPTAIKIMESTNLIRPYQPEYAEGCCASIIACEQFERYLANPKRYTDFFSRYSNTDLIRKWTSPDNQNCKLYEGKFSTTFYDYCVEHHLARPFEQGIYISKDLAFVYMSLLADIISKNQEYEMFTDIGRYDTLLLYNDRATKPSQRTYYQKARTEIEFAIPTQINNIPLDTIIALRKDRSFDSGRRAFVFEFENYMRLRQKDPNASFEEALRIRGDILNIISKLFGPIKSLYLAFKDVAGLPLVDTLSIAIDNKDDWETSSLQSYIGNIRSKKQANRYLAKLRKSVHPYSTFKQ